MRAFFALFLLALVLPGLSQGPQQPNEAVIAAMKPFSFLVGHWKGEGWSLMQGKKLSSSVEEKISFKAGGTVLVMEGIGKDPDGKVVHNAFGVISYDPETKQFRMRSHIQSGRSGEYAITVKDGVIVWTIPAERTIRYTIKLDAKGRWHEIGEVNTSGDTWFQFFEMTLTKVN